MYYYYSLMLLLLLLLLLLSACYVLLAKLEDGLIAARKYASQASILIEIMMFHSEFPCFKVRTTQ